MVWTGLDCGELHLSGRSLKLRSHSRSCGRKECFACSVMRVWALLCSCFMIPASRSGLPATSLGCSRSLVWGGLGFALI